MQAELATNETIAISTYTASLAWLQSSTGEPQLLQYFRTVFLKIQKCAGFCVIQAIAIQHRQL